MSTRRRHRSVSSSRDRPSEGGRAEVQIGTPEDGTMHRSVADRRLHGATRPRSDDPVETNRGRQSSKGYHSREVFPVLPNSEICGKSPNSICPRGRIRLGIRRPRSASGAAQIVAEQSENALVPASAASAVTLLPQHRAPTRSEWPLQRWDDPLRLSPRHLPRESPRLWVSPRPPPFVCGPDRVASPESIDVPNRPVPSGHDRAANPSVSGIHPGSIRVGCLCGGVRFFPDTRTPDKPHSRGEQIAALKRRG